MCTLPKGQTQINSLDSMKEYDIAIIGGGPAGIMAAIAASQNSSNVILLEKNSQLGRKLLLTGGGRCNITNSKPIKQLLTFFNNKNFLKHSLQTRIYFRFLILILLRKRTIEFSPKAENQGMSLMV